MSAEMIAFLESCNKSRLKPGDCVEGTWEKTCRICSNATGIIIEAVKEKLWKVKVNQTCKHINVCSCAMKIIDDAVGVPVEEVVEKVNKYIII